jgi:hypothetical protein
MAEALGTNADLTTAFTKWLTANATVGAVPRDRNTKMRNELAQASAYNVTQPADLTTLLTRFLRTRNAP